VVPLPVVHQDGVAGEVGDQGCDVPGVLLGVEVPALDPAPACRESWVACRMPLRSSRSQQRLLGCERRADRPG
jgi:hypothetical protein